MKGVRCWVIAAGMALSVAACETPNSIAMKVGAPPEGAVELRALETRRFDTTDNVTIMAAATQTLQDLGFTISESTSEAGVLVASKQRDAQETGQIAGQVAATVLLALLGSYHDPVWDESQRITVTLVVSPIENSKQVDVRVSFDRVLTNNKGVQWRAELINDKAIYKEFFEKFSSSVFLEAHQV